MAVTVSGTSITFNDATVQTTAATAPTTAQVLSATAGATARAVGTYTIAKEVLSNTTAVNGTRSGSLLQAAGGDTGTGLWFAPAGDLAGTWRNMGIATSQNVCSFWLRIS